MKFTFSLILTLYLSLLCAQTKNTALAETKEDATIDQLKTNFKKYEQFVNSKKTDSILAVSDKIIKICSDNFSKDDLARSEKVYDLAAFQFSKFRDQEQLGKLYNDKGIDYLNVQFYSIALKQFKQSEAYYKKSPFPCLATSPTNNLGQIYYLIGDHKSARSQYLQSIQYLKQCTGVLSETDVKNEMILREMNLSIILIDKKKYGQAEREFAKLIDTPDFEKDVSTYTRLLIYENLLISKSNLAAPLRSQKLEDQVLRINEKSLSDQEKNLYQEVLAYIYAFKSDKARSYSSIYLAMKISEREKDQYSLMQNYTAMIFLAKKFGDLDYVMKYQQKLIALNTDFLTINANRNVQEFSALYKLNDLEKEKLHFRNQNIINRSNLKVKETENSLFKVILAVLFFAVLITIFLVMIYRKRSNLLAAQKNTIEKKNAELERIGKDLSHSNKTIRNTFSIIAHDLRNPFNALLGYTTLLINNFDHFNDDEKLADLKKINNAAETNYNLTQNLLSWSLKQQGGYVISKTENNFRELVDHCVESLSAFVRSKNIQILNKTQNISVFVDRDIILTILNNLLSNGIKNSKENTNVEILSFQQNEKIILEICNQYEYLDEETLVYIQKYMASKSEENLEYEIGLGLKIAKEMSDLHNANIEFEKQADKIVVKLIFQKR